ncbi:unnamed protein product [Staurois parvus]|uniref:Uncharacterized protein n=1 Tax=Staurois parvus TaxID=386267 RepID=A0ABN9AYG8_9NEOB|nr:unnamed protein product [Staurois parvus]
MVKTSQGSGREMVTAIRVRLWGGGSATKAISLEQRTGTAGVRPYGNLSTAKVCLNRAPCAVIGARCTPVCATATAAAGAWVPVPACCCA